MADEKYGIQYILLGIGDPKTMPCEDEDAEVAYDLIMNNTPLGPGYIARGRVADLITRLLIQEGVGQRG